MGIAETHCCWVLFLAGLGCSLFLVDFPLTDDDCIFYRDLLDTIVPTSAVIAGLLSVSSGIFQANTEKWLNDLLMSTGIMAKIQRYYRTAVMLGAYTSCLAFAMILLLKKAPESNFTAFAFHLLAGLGAASLAAYLRSLEIYGMISKAQEQKAEQQRKNMEFVKQATQRELDRRANKPADYDEGEM